MIAHSPPSVPTLGLALANLRVSPSVFPVSPWLNLLGVRGEFCMSVDDDNAIAPDYLVETARASFAHIVGSGPVGRLSAEPQSGKGCVVGADAAATHDLPVHSLELGDAGKS